MTDGEPENVISASLQKIKSIKNPIMFFQFVCFLFCFLFFIKSETSDSFVNHFDGHFAYLKTLEFYFKESLFSVCLSLSLCLFRSLFISAQLSSDAVSALRKVRVLI